VSEKELDSFERWCLVDERLQETTIDNYKYYLSKIPRSLFDNPKYLNKWLRVNPFTSSTSSKLYGACCAVRKFYKFLDKEKYIEHIKIPRWTSKEKKFSLSEEEENRLINCCETEEERLIIKLLLATGIRRGIITELRRKDLDVKKNIITVRDFYLGNKAKIEFFIPIPESLKLELVDYMNRKNKKDNDKIFVLTFTKKNRLETYKNQGWALYNLVQKIGKKAGVHYRGQSPTPHLLRHAFGTKFYRISKDLHITRQVLGHKKVISTHRYIAPASEEEIINAYRKVFEDTKIS